MHGESETGKPFRQHSHNLASIRFELAADDKVSGKGMAQRL
jgi:hypothetical protein